MPGQAPRQRYKVLVLGPPAVGKTALVRRLAGGSFDGSASSQRGLDWYTCHVPLRDDVAVTLQLWDLSACPTRPGDNPASLSTYLFNSQAVLAVYDVSDPASLESLRHVLDLLVTTVTATDAAADRGASTDACSAIVTRPYLALVANKCDLRWAASEPLARQLAARHGCVRFELSAKTGAGVAQAAVQLACDLAGVPLTATEHNRRFAAAGALGPLGFAATPDASRGGQGAPGSPGAWAAMALTGAAQPWAAPAAAPDVDAQSRRQLAPGSAYRLPAEAAQACAAAGDAAGEHCSAAGTPGAAPQVRPANQSAGTPSPTAVVISRKGPLGQRSGGRAASPVALAAAAPSPAIAAGDAVTASPQEPTAETGEAARAKGCRGRWRALCCCGRQGGA